MKLDGARKTYSTGGIPGPARRRRLRSPSPPGRPRPSWPTWRFPSARPTRERSSRPCSGETCRTPRPAATCATPSRESGRPCPGPALARPDPRRPDRGPGPVGRGRGRAQFERLVADGGPPALEQIAGLYRGRPAGRAGAGRAPFEEWLTSERERLHELAIQALGRLLTHQQGAGAAEPAVQTGLRLLALDPLQEPVHRALMRLYARLGRREAALRQYQLCVDALKRELSAAPEAETNQLYQEILHSRPVHARPGPESGPAGGDAAPAPTPSPVRRRGRRCRRPRRRRICRRRPRS